MSQRTRSRTTAAAARKRPSVAHDTGASASATPSPRSFRGDVGAAATQSGDTISGSPSPCRERGPGGEDHPLSPESLARTLRAVAAELERDPALARRVASAIATDSAGSVPSPDMTSAGASTGHPDPARADGAEAHRPGKRHPARAFTPSLVTGISPDLGPGIPDPFALANRLGPDGLRAVLAGLRRGTLRAMIREHSIAPAAQVAHITDDARLREMILAAVLK